MKRHTGLLLGIFLVTAAIFSFGHIGMRFSFPPSINHSVTLDLASSLRRSSTQEFNVPPVFRRQCEVQGINYGLPYGRSTFLIGIPPFAGVDVRRLPGQDIKNVLPSGYLLNHNTRFWPSHYAIADTWSGSLWGHPFILQMYKERSRSQMLLVDRFNGIIRAVIEIPRRTMQIASFTGNYIVFVEGIWISGLNSPYMALNIIAGKLVSKGTRPDIMTGSYPDMGAHPAFIEGLSIRYSNGPL